MKLTKQRTFSLACLLATSVSVSSPLLAGAEDDPLLTMLTVDQLEYRDAEGSDPLVLSAQGWVGKDLNKIWLKAEAERVGNDLEEAELQALYSRAVAPYWDFQLGIRRDFKPSPSRNWAVLGFQGLAPYFFDINTALFIGEGGSTALRLEAEYELMFTQKLILVPEVEADIYGQNDNELGIGSGLSSIESGLRLRYEVRREFAPYVGINWSKQYGNTADFARAAGDNTEDWQLVFGISAWY